MNDSTTTQCNQEHLDPEIQEELRRGREFMREYDETFRALAQSESLRDSEET